MGCAAWIVIALSGVAQDLGEETLGLSFEGMAPYVGLRFELRVTDRNTGGEVTRITLPAAPAAFDLEIVGLSAGQDLRIDFYVDANENGGYDAPPDDHAWRMELSSIQGGENVTFAPTEDFVDISWPPYVNGEIDDKEYPNVLNDETTNMAVYWQNDEAVLIVGLRFEGVGWVAIGFEPNQRMAGANIIIAAVSDGVLVIEDHFGASATSHRQDTVSDLLTAAGTEGDGITTVEFSLPLEPSDENDSPLSPGSEIAVILAVHATSDRLTSRHTARSTRTIQLD